ncbi:MAG: ABC transporter ATP-binding protein [Clostridia bacterium]|nr:ABC transporter ATP-binding protein [Clostridia bacterium]
MLSYMKPHKKAMFLCFGLVIVITLLELWRPEIIGNAIDHYINKGEPGERVDERFAGILQAAGLYLAALLLLFVCNRVVYITLQKTGQSIIYTMRNEVFEHVQKLSMRFFDTTPVGKIVTRVTNDVEAINDLYSNILVNLFRNTIKIIGLAVVMLAMNPTVALYGFIMIPIVITLTYVFRKIARRAYSVVKTKITALNTYLSEHLSGMKLIQIFNQEDRKFESFQEKNGELYKAGFKELMINAVFRPCIYLTSIIALAIILGEGSRGVLTGALSIGMLYKFVQYINSFFEPVQNLAEQLTTLQSAVASAEKIFTLLDTKPIVNDPEEPEVLPAVRGEITFENVWFAYNDVDWVLRDVSFTIKPGQKVAFVGATGAGKSSILNLIGRYYDIQKGSIKIDGVDIRLLSREQIRRAIGQVQQDVFIFTGDIASNIRLRNEEITDEQVKAAAVHVNANRFIDKLHGGYREHVSERGSTFSAGQRQLLSFARTLAYDPVILILDEATANIDTETEQWIQDALQKLMEGRTTIMVAHRLSTIQHADKIMVMHKGKIRESGTHQELLEKDGIYKKLYELQLAGMEEKH